jgi:hypothetical protein
LPCPLQCFTREIINSVKQKVKRTAVVDIAAALTDPAFFSDHDPHPVAPIAAGRSDPLDTRPGALTVAARLPMASICDACALFRGLAQRLN